MKSLKFISFICSLFFLTNAYAGITCFKANPIHGEMERIITVSNTYGPEGLMGSYLGVDKAGLKYLKSSSIKEAVLSSSATSSTGVFIVESYRDTCAAAVSSGSTLNWSDIREVTGSKRYNEGLAFTFSMSSRVLRNGSRKASIALNLGGKSESIEGLSCFVEEG